MKVDLLSKTIQAKYWMKEKKTGILKVFRDKELVTYK